MSLLLTASVLISTVVAIYAILPARHDVLMTRSLDAHRAPPPFQLEQPTQAELRAFGLALFQRPVPWPEIQPHAAPPIDILGAAGMTVLDRRAALVRYRVGQRHVTLVVQRAREVPPRRRTRAVDDMRAIAWRHDGWTFVAVGPAAAADAWRAFVRAP